MNRDFDDFSDAIKNVDVNRKKKEFKLNQLKLEHHHWSSGDIDIGMPITTSIELSCKYDFELEKIEWYKTIKHTYISLEDYKKYSKDEYTEKIDNPDMLTRELEKYDLREYKNNYFTETNPENFSHWELSYNYYFKISGTYDQEIEVFTKISSLLDFKKIISEELKKIQNKIERNQN